MSHKFKTDRLQLCQLNPSDWPDFLTLLQIPSVIRYCFDALSVDEIQSSFDARLKKWDMTSNHWLCFSVYDQTGEQFLGVNGFRLNGDDANEAELGFLFLPEFHGKGYATESLAAIMDYARSLGILSLIAQVTEGNHACCRVLEKRGFTLVRDEHATVEINHQVYKDLRYQYLFSDKKHLA